MENIVITETNFSLMPRLRFLFCYFCLHLSVSVLSISPFFYILRLLFLTVLHSVVRWESLVSVIPPIIYCVFEYSFTSTAVFAILYLSLSWFVSYSVHALIPVSVLLYPENPAVSEWIILTLFQLLFRGRLWSECNKTAKDIVRAPLLLK